jgi:predicted lactoylglutathione lyase
MRPPQSVSPAPRNGGGPACSIIGGDIVAVTQSRKLFLNLPVRNLERSMTFFKTLGFAFNPQFTDDTAACMVLGEDAYVMLLTEARFKDFTRKQICDTSKAIEGLWALSCESRAEVDEIVKKALASGGTAAMDATDHGFMYVWSFLDPDGHHWEVFWMDPAFANATGGQALEAAGERTSR